MTTPNRHRTKQYRHSGKIVAGVFAAALIAISFGAYLSNNRLSSNQRSTDTASEQTLGTSTTPITNQNYTVSISDIRSAPASEANLTRWTATVSIYNPSVDILEISPLLQMHLVDESGTKYNMTAEFNQDMVFGGPLASGDNYRQELDFNVPKGIKPVFFTFQLNQSSPVESFPLEGNIR